MKNAYRLLLMLSLSMVFACSYAYDLVVAKDGSGNYTTVQAAIDAAPTGAISAYTIYIKNGTYKEKITVPSNKPFLTIIGESADGVVLTYDDYASRVLPGGGTVGTLNSASFTINATDFTAINLTFVNSYGDGSQAVAVAVSADRAVFKNCRFLGNQDTLYVRGSGTPRHYFNNCYIDGNVDFIFGNSVAVFDSCVVYAKARTSTTTSYITAANTPPGQTYGFVFRDCQLPDNNGTTQYYLGRPWQNSTGSTPLANNKTVYLNCRMGNKIKPEGWSTWDAGTQTDLITYAEYKSKWYSGDLQNTTSRVAWSKQLSDVEAGQYTVANMFSGWDPCTVYAGICNAQPYRLYINNFKGAKGASVSTFTWNLSWPKNGVDFKLWRSANRNGGYAQAGRVGSTDDSTINFQLTDPIPPSGSIYYYCVTGAIAGSATVFSDTVFISSAPTINATGPVAAMYQTIGTPSPTVSYTLSGTDLSGNVTVTPPANFEVSANGGANWYTSATPLVLVPTGGTLSATTILVRLNATTAADYSGNISHTSPGADNVDLPISGKAVNAPAINSVVLLRFPLIANATDNAADRSPAVNASTITGKNLYVSNGTTVAAIAPYSATYGYAFGATANGDGSWGTAVGGPGGNLNRIFYQQVLVETNVSPVRIDSIILASAFYNTSSNTKLGIVYSLTDFTTNDSTNISGGTGPGGTAVTGSFTTPITLANQTSGPTNVYRLALNGGTGVTVPAGGRLTIRLYFSCGSSSAGRYGMVKELLVKGEQTGAVLPLQLLQFNGKLRNGKSVLQWQTTNEKQVKQYEVEYSSNGSNFQKGGTVAAHNGIGLQNYSFTHEPLKNSQHYYRLRMVDIDGKYSFSKTIVLSSSVSNSLKIYPNPASHKLTVTCDASIRQMTVYNMQGKMVMQVNVKQSGSTQSLDISALATGVYELTALADGQTMISKFVKQ